jgi:hypothetical protein
MSITEVMVAAFLLTLTVGTSVRVTVNSLQTIGKASDTDAVMAKMGERAELLRGLSVSYLCRSLDDNYEPTQVSCNGDLTLPSEYGDGPDHANLKKVCASQAMGESFLAYVAEKNPELLRNWTVRNLTITPTLTPVGDAIQLAQQSSRGHKLHTTLVPAAHGWCP